MKVALTTLAITTLLLSCKESHNNKTQPKETKIELTDFKEKLEKASVKGTILIYDNNQKTYYSNDFKWAQSGFLPASTFKIPNSIIALETGVISTDSTIIPWNGEKHRFKIWEQDLTLKQAFHYSCVPCYQSIARQVGLKQMQNQLSGLNFGQMVVSDSNLDMFWLEGQSRITPFDQIDFLKRFQSSNLPISEQTELVMKSLMIITENDSIVLRGKTGWSNENQINNGWFVGYIERKDNIYYFATNIEPINGLELKTFAETRKTITYNALNSIFSK